MITDTLAYTALVVRDVASLAGILEHNFGLPRTDCAVGGGSDTVPVFAVGRSALALFDVGDAFVDGAERPGVHHIALGASDPAALAQDIADAGVPLDAATGRPALGGGERWRLSPDATHGVLTYTSPPLALARGEAGWIERIDHLGLACADNDIVEDAFARRMGFPIESRQTDMEVTMAVESFTSDKYGVVYHNRRPEPQAGVRAAFISIGDTELELIQNFDPRQDGEVYHGQTGTTRQDQGAIVRFVQSRGPGLHHIAFKCADIDSGLRALREAGIVTIDEAGRPGGRRSLIGFIHPKSMGGVLFHLVQREELPK